MVGLCRKNRSRVQAHWKGSAVLNGTEHKYILLNIPVITFSFMLLFLQWKGFVSLFCTWLKEYVPQVFKDDGWMIYYFCFSLIPALASWGHAHLHTITLQNIIYHKNTSSSALKGPAGPQGPIGYPGPRGVKVYIQLMFICNVAPYRACIVF